MPRIFSETDFADAPATQTPSRRVFSDSDFVDSPEPQAPAPTATATLDPVTEQPKPALMQPEPLPEGAGFITGQTLKNATEGLRKDAVYFYGGLMGAEGSLIRPLATAGDFYAEKIRNVLGLPQPTEPSASTKYADYLQEMSGLTDAAAETVAPPVKGEKIAGSVMKGAGGAAVVVPVLGPAGLGRLGVGALPALGAVEASATGDPKEVAKAAASGLVLGTGLKLTGPLAPSLRIPSQATLFGGLAAAEGSDLEDVIGQSVFGAAMAVPGANTTFRESVGEMSKGAETKARQFDWYRRADEWQQQQIKDLSDAIKSSPAYQKMSDWQREQLNLTMEQQIAELRQQGMSEGKIIREMNRRWRAAGNQGPSPAYQAAMEARRTPEQQRPATEPIVPPSPEPQAPAPEPQPAPVSQEQVLAEIAADPILFGLPEQVRMEFAQRAVGNGVEDAMAFLQSLPTGAAEGVNVRRGADNQGARRGVNARLRENVPEDAGMLAAQERYPAPQAPQAPQPIPPEVMADPRFKMYRDAGYGDADAAQMVRADMDADLTEGLGAVEETDAELAKVQSEAEAAEQRGIEEAQTETEQLAPQERYPAKPTEDEKRGDARYRQYRRAGYTDAEAMDFVEQDLLEDKRGALNAPMEKANATVGRQAEREPERPRVDAGVEAKGPDRQQRPDQPEQGAGDGSRNRAEEGAAVEPPGLRKIKETEARRKETLPSPDASAGQPARENVAPEPTGRPAGRSGVGEVAVSKPTTKQGERNEQEAEGSSPASAGSARSPAVQARPGIGPQAGREGVGRPPDSEPAGRQAGSPEGRAPAEGDQGGAVAAGFSVGSRVKMAKSPRTAIIESVDTDPVDGTRYYNLKDEQTGAVTKNATEDDFTAIKEPAGLKKIRETEAKRKATNEDKVRAESAATRWRPKEKIVFEKPYIGPSGSSLVAYEWQWMPESYVDQRGEDRVKRVSNWDDAELNEETGRMVVHQFVVKRPDGGTQTVSAETALQMLGYQTKTESGSMPSLVSAVKTLARLRMERDQLATQMEAEKKIADSVQALPLPPQKENTIQLSVAENGPLAGQKKTMRVLEMEDARVWLHDGPADGERRQTLIESWRDKRRVEQGSKEDWRIIRDRINDRDRRIAKQEAKINAINAATTPSVKVEPVAAPSKPSTEKPAEPPAATGKRPEKVKPPLPDGQTEIAKDQALAIFGGRKNLIPKPGETKPQPSDTTGRFFIGQTDDGRFWTQERESIPAAVKVKTAPDGDKTISVPSADKPGLPPKEQKKYLLAEIDKAIEGAQYDTTAEMPHPMDKVIADLAEARQWKEGESAEASKARENATADRFQAQGAELGIDRNARNEKGESEYPNVYNFLNAIDDAARVKKLAEVPRVTIEVPGDGTFEIINSKEVLKRFRDMAKEFPVSVLKPNEGRRVSMEPTSIVAVARKRPVSREDMENAAGVALSEDEKRKILTEIHVDAENKTMVATDGRRMAIALKAPFKATHKKGEYPNYKQVIPGGRDGKMPDTANMEKAAVDSEVLSRKLNQAISAVKAIPTTKGRSEGTETPNVSLYLTPEGMVEVAATAADVGGYESGDISKGKLIGSFNAKFLKDGLTFLRKMGNDSVTLAWTDGISPIMLLGSDEFYILMPMSDSGVPLQGARIRMGSEDRKYRRMLPPEDYRGVHRAPLGEYGEGSLDAMDRTYPDDVYAEDAALIYGDSVDPKLDAKIARLIRFLRGKPDATVKVYRAVPKGVQSEIAPGDWVTPIYEYAARHGERFDAGYDVLERTVKAGEVFTEGNSLYEYGWQPKQEGQVTDEREDGRTAGTSDAGRSVERTARAEGAGTGNETGPAQGALGNEESRRLSEAEGRVTDETQTRYRREGAQALSRSELRREYERERSEALRQGDEREVSQWRASVFDENHYTAPWVAQERKFFDRRGIGLVLVKGGGFKGFYDPRRKLIFVQTNDATVTPEAIARHEKFHILYSERDPQVLELMSQLNATTQFLQYVERYRASPRDIRSAELYAEELTGQTSGDDFDAAVMVHIAEEFVAEQLESNQFNASNFTQPSVAKSLADDIRGNKYTRMQEGQVTDDYSEGAGQAIPDGQAELWRTRLDSVRNGGTRFDQERLAQVQVDEAATADPAFQEAYQIAKANGFELVPVTGLDYGGVLIGNTILVSTDTARWGNYKATLAHEVFHSRVAQGEPAAVAAVAAVRKDDAAIAAYMDRLDRVAPNWYQEMFADSRRRLGPQATAEQINADILDQIAEEIAADAAMDQEIPPRSQQARTGQPLSVERVYHGTPDPLKPFEQRDTYFTDNRALAEGYTWHRGMWRSKSQTPSVREASLSFDNPLVIDAQGTRSDNIPVPWQEWKPKVFGNLPKNAVNMSRLVAYAKDKGHDGLVVQNVIDTADVEDRTKSTVYVAFDPARQVQEASGSRKYKRGAAVTPAQDAEYMAAVERGDTETAQRMVDEELARRPWIRIGRDDYERIGRTINRLPASDNAYASRDEWATPDDVYPTLRDAKDAVDRILRAPITRDDFGNVIPLSQRFNVETPDIRYRKHTEQEGEAQNERRQWQETDSERESAFQLFRANGGNYFVSQARRAFQRAIETSSEGAYGNNSEELSAYLSEAQIDVTAYDDPRNQEFAARCLSHGFIAVHVVHPNAQVEGFTLMGGSGPRIVLIAQHNADFAQRHEFFHVLDSQGYDIADSMKKAVDSADSVYRRYKEKLAEAQDIPDPDAIIRTEVAADQFAHRYDVVAQERKYRRLPAKEFPAVSKDDLDRINAKLAALSKGERLKAVMQAKAKVREFRKGEPAAKSVPGLVAEAERAGEKEVKDAGRLLKAAIQPREKAVYGKALDRLDQVFSALRIAQDAVDAIPQENTEARAEEARQQLARRLFHGRTDQARTLAQYRPVKLLEALLKRAEKVIRRSKIAEVKNAMDRYSKMRANEPGDPFKDLPNEYRPLMDEWLAMAELTPLADVPTVQPDQWKLNVTPGDEFVDAADNTVGRLDTTIGAAFFTDPAYVDLKTLYETLNAIEAAAGEALAARKLLIAQTARTDASRVTDDILATGRLANPVAAAAEREATGEDPQERFSWLRGHATKFRSIFGRNLGKGSHAWELVEDVRKGDSDAKGMKFAAEQELAAVLEKQGIDREEERRWRTEKILVKLPGRRNPVAMTRGEMISLYNTLQDPASRDILLSAGAKRKAMRDDSSRIRADSRDPADNRVLFSAFERRVQGDAKLLAVAEAMQRVMVKHGQAANEVSRYYSGRDEFTNEFYWPRSVQRQQQIVTEDELMSARRVIDFNLQNAGLSKRRVSHRNPLLIEDAFSLFESHMGELSRYAHLTIPANRLLNSLTTTIDHKRTGPDTTAMRQFQLSFGEQYKRYIGNGIRAIMAGGLDPQDGQYAKMFRKLGRRISGAVLALSPSAIGMNRYGGMANMSAWLGINAPGTIEQKTAIRNDFLKTAALPQSLKGPEVEALMKNGYLADRWSGKSLRLALTLMGGEFAESDFRLFRAIDAAADKLNRPLTAREMAVSVAAYKALTRNGVSSAEAVDLIEQANRDTQNSTSDMDKSEAARELGGFLSTYFPFTSQGLVQWDFYMDAVAQGRREGWGKMDRRRTAILTAAVLNLMLLPLLIGALMKLLRKDDPVEDPALAGLDAVLNATEQRVPFFRLVGEGARAAAAGYRGRPVNMVESALADVTSSAGRLAHGKGNYQDAITFTTQTAKMLGAPVGGASQWLKALLAQLGFETEGMKNRRKDSWFDDKIEDLPRRLTTTTLNALADGLYEKAKADKMVPSDYNRGDFRQRIRTRYQNDGGTITDAKPKSLADY